MGIKSAYFLLVLSSAILPIQALAHSYGPPPRVTAGPGFATFDLKMERVIRYPDGRVTRDEHTHAPEGTVADQLTALLRLNPGVTTKRFEDLAFKKNLGRNRARDFLSNGVLSGSICRESSGNRHSHHLPPEPQK